MERISRLSRSVAGLVVHITGAASGMGRATAELFANGVLDGLNVVITAGPTRESLDPVRYISNHSSGKMGYALAAAAVEAGARTTLVSGPVNLTSRGRETDMAHGAAFHDNLVQVVRDE